MKTIICEAPGETFTIFQGDDGTFFCPVCGAALPWPPYEKDGSASLEICHCGFHFGFDDTPLASKDAVDGIRANWKRWRRQLIERAAKDSTSLSRLEHQLKNIHVRLAFDLIDVDE